jgi:hypothetical protein
MREDIQNDCRTENGEMVCKRFQRNKDGSETDLAIISTRVDGQCNEVVSKMTGSEKELENLYKFQKNKLSAKCKRAKEQLPENYE